ncbi:MAG: T9SS type A sorting domain-containing protein [Bacteroidales bacterium]|nr:T9SS type A sorting domain-containing protein [Bacteroidales bacterium]
MYWKIFKIVYLFLGACRFMMAQPVITESHMPKPNQYFYISKSTDNLDPSYFAPGENLSWDFSSLISLSRDTINFYHVISSEVPLVYATVFYNPLNPSHKATVCKRDDDFSMGPSVEATDVFSFFKLTSSAFIQVGTGATINGVPTAIQWTPTDTIYDLPLSYQSSGSSYSFYDINIPSIGYFSEKRWRQYEVNAYGNAVTPMGTFNTLRVRTNMQYHDSIYYEQFGFGFPIQRSETIYEWYTPDFSIPLVRIIQNFQMNRIEFIDTSNITGLASYLAVPFTIYPVPASDQINILTSCEPPFFLQVFDPLGKIILSEYITEKKSIFVFPVTDFNDGIYFLQLKKSENVYQRKFIIQR